MHAGSCSAEGAKSGGSFTYWSMWSKDEPQAKVLQSAITAFTATSAVCADVDVRAADHFG